MSPRAPAKRSRIFLADLPSQRVLVLFIVVGLLCLTMLGWWILFQVEQTGSLVQVRLEEMQARRFEAAHRLAARTELGRGSVPGFPDLMLRPPSGGAGEGPEVGGLELVVRPERIAELELWHHRRLVMFVSEGTFFVGLLLAGLGLIYLTLRRQVMLHRQQSNFVAAVSHELRSPLASLRLYLETLQMGRAREPAVLQRSAETMLSDVDRLEGLIENILDAAQLDARGGLRLDLEAACLSELLTYWLDELRPAVERRSGRLDAEIQPGLHARVDAPALRTAVRNLLDNAVKYGGKVPAVDVRLRAEHSELILEVRDHGIGIERHELVRVFERFYRAGDEMGPKHSRHGTGALSGARNRPCARRQGVGGQPGTGRGHDDRAPAAADPGAGTGRGLAMSEAVEHRIILIAEDEEHLGEGICLNLEAEGYRVLWARDGDEALDLWRENRVDLLILDVMLPKKSGFEVCEGVRASGSRTPILFLTAKTRAEDRIHGLELGADDYLGKPFHLKELLLRIEAMFRRQEWSRGSDGSSSVLKFGPNTIDFNRYEGVSADGERFELTQKECLLLKLLAEHSGQVVSRDEILDKVWGVHNFPTPRTVDNFIARLRRRFEANAAEPRYIHTLRGVGYRFTP